MHIIQIISWIRASIFSLLIMGVGMGCASSEQAQGESCAPNCGEGDLEVGSIRGQTPFDRVPGSPVPVPEGGETPEEQDSESSGESDGEGGEDSAAEGEALTPDESCQEKCGVPWVGTCSCAPLCGAAGICCEDFESECEDSGGGDELPSAEEGGGNPESASCVGVCGGIAATGCSCASNCQETGTCCPDVCNACGYCPAGQGNEPAGGPASCVGICGGQAPAGCFCDEGCATFGDCCDDACTECGACAGFGSEGGGFPGRFLVATANVENLPTLDASPSYCQGDWEDLPYFFGAQTFPPDLLLVQQINGSEQVEALLTALQVRTGETYGSVLANEAPGEWGAAECDYKKNQTNGILYRQERFQVVPDSLLPILALESTPEGECVSSDADRYRGIAAEFTDTFAGGLRVAVASVRWPSGGGCETDNLENVRTSLNAYSEANLHVWGGDLAASDLEFQDESAPFTEWYTSANHALSDDSNSVYRDVMYRHCEQTAGAGGLNPNCLIYSWTLFATDFADRLRTAFLFTRVEAPYGALSQDLPPVSGGQTITFEDAGAAEGTDDDPLPYSKSRGLMGYIHW